MNCADAFRDGLPIATGIIEGACRNVVKDRMDRTGARLVAHRRRGRAPSPRRESPL